jgi:hypothetical protein
MTTNVSSTQGAPLLGATPGVTKSERQGPEAPSAFFVISALMNAVDAINGLVASSAEMVAQATKAQHEASDHMTKALKEASDKVSNAGTDSAAVSKASTEYSATSTRENSVVTQYGSVVDMSNSALSGAQTANQMQLQQAQAIVQGKDFDKQLMSRG